MKLYNLHWTELCNIEVEAKDEDSAKEIFKLGEFSCEDVERDFVDGSLDVQEMED